MFDNISSSLSKILDNLSGKKFISEDHLNTTMREIRVALISADVALPVAKSFIEQVKEKALGEQVIKNVNPGQMITKIVNDELIEILGSEKTEINLDQKPPITLLIVGLQGSGKTTTSGKLANYLYQKKNKKRILLASLDVYRPAAAEQLAILAEQIGVDNLAIKPGETPAEISKRAIAEAKKYNYDILILDSAGRTHINEELMSELSEVKKIAQPDETLLVVDSMIGQDAINLANNFKEQIGLDGIILTRIDGDSRSGVAITMRFATGCPIKFLGIGEKISDLENFDPQRIASRILGMGDIVSLVEKAQDVISQDEMKKAEKQFRKGKFDFDDLASQLKNMKKMGGFGSILGMLPGAGKIKEQVKNSNFDEKELLQQEALISSMTKKERSNPNLLQMNSSRKRRIAAGAGKTIQDINRLIKKHKQMQKMMQKVGKMDKNSLKEMMGDISAGGEMPDFSQFKR